MSKAVKPGAEASKPVAPSALNGCAHKPEDGVWGEPGRAFIWPMGQSGNQITCGVKITESPPCRQPESIQETTPNFVCLDYIAPLHMSFWIITVIRKHNS